MSKGKADRQKELLGTESSSGQLLEEERREMIKEGTKETRGPKASRDYTPGGSKQGDLTQSALQKNCSESKES